MPIWDGEAAQRSAEEEWGAEEGAAEGGELSQKLLGRRPFLDALFQLADVWAEGGTADDYARFLTGLYSRVTLTVTLSAAGLRRLWRLTLPLPLPLPLPS